MQTSELSHFRSNTITSTYPEFPFRSYPSSNPARHPFTNHTESYPRPHLATFTRIAAEDAM